MIFGRLVARLTFRRPPPVVGVVRLGGVIGPATPLRGGLNLSGMATLLERAFNLPGLQAVALSINSPGGSPAQSALIHTRIRALASEKDIPVMAFVEDVAASGGYWLACAADEIFVDENSIVGSIGVIYSGFGFVDAIEKLGIERRLYTEGDKKSLLDPFRPQREDDVARLKTVQRGIHDNFKAVVRLRRGHRLARPEEELFSGEFWIGSRAVELGLADAIGELRSVLRERYGRQVVLRTVGRPRGWLRRRFGLSGGLFGDAEAAAGGWADGLLGALEARAWWGRYGL